MEQDLQELAEVLDLVARQVKEEEEWEDLLVEDHRGCVFAPNAERRFHTVGVSHAIR